MSITQPHPAVETERVHPGSSDSVTLPRGEYERNCSCPAANNDSSRTTAFEVETVHPVCTDSISATGVGLFLSGVAAGALGVLLIVGIVGGACRLRRSKHHK